MFNNPVLSLFHKDSPGGWDNGRSNGFVNGCHDGRDNRVNGGNGFGGRGSMRNDRGGRGGFRGKSSGSYSPIQTGVFTTRLGTLALLFDYRTCIAAF